MNPLSSPEGNELLLSFRTPLRQLLRDLDALNFEACLSVLPDCRRAVDSAELRASNAGDEVHNDLFVLSRYLAFFEQYCHLWDLVSKGKFSESWRTLQDALDSIRLIRKFSNVDMTALEDQLLELEKTYPYGVFFSIGALVERFECSICGEDIDGLICKHRRGNLYRGKMAVAIARNIVNFDHVALVDCPEDRRCVVQYDDAGEQFKLVRFLSQLVTSKTYKISDFGALVYSKRVRSNPDYRKLGRNDLCFCASGKKFKRCCIEKSEIEGDHVDITPRPMPAERAVA